ncbi:hypothetical protein ILUMI_14906 [Ignelater luminosus]|uniref:Uncharacterized protein n=1 Tax=Ignelater luminosus TaxID=2038154 RepID=A0A8K0G7C8_IGNLU|nr:hypothetical protein ILUMI_14906 [Ignelater luminosus]
MGSNELKRKVFDISLEQPEGENRIFQKSKLIEKSTDKETINMEQILQVIQEMRNEMAEEKKVASLEEKIEIEEQLSNKERQGQQRRRKRKGSDIGKNAQLEPEKGDNGEETSTTWNQHLCRKRPDPTRKRYTKTTKRRSKTRHEINETEKRSKQKQKINSITRTYR